MSYGNQRVREGHKLIDVHIHVDHPDEAQRHKAHELLPKSPPGQVDDVLKNDNAHNRNVSSAAFTDMLKKVGKLKVNVFGWDYKKVKTILTSLNGTVKESPTGLITCMASRSKEKRLRTLAIARRRWGSFEVVGQVKGAFEAPESLRKQAIDEFENLKRHKVDSTRDRRQAHQP